MTLCEASPAAKGSESVLPKLYSRVRQWQLMTIRSYPVLEFLACKTKVEVGIWKKDIDMTVNSTRGLDSATALKFVQSLRMACDFGS